MPNQGKLYALLIGINDYECDGVRKLRFAVADVLALHGVLAERAGLDARNCFVLSHPASGGGPSPRRADVLRALAQFSKAPMTPDDTFLLYFAGHGFTAGEKSYLLTVDSDPALPELLAETAVSLETVNRFTRQIAAGQQLLILDACRNDPTTLGRSGGAACLDAAMARDIATLVREQPAAASVPRSARAILSACWEGQVSYEYPARSHGWFSYNLLQSLRAHPSGWLDVAEMAEQIRQRMIDNAWRDLPEAVGQEPHVLLEGRPVRLSLAPCETPPLRVPTDPTRRHTCPACGRGLKVAGEYAGRQVPCPACGVPLKVAEDLGSLALVPTPAPEVAMGQTPPSPTPAHAIGGAPKVVSMPAKKAIVTPQPLAQEADRAVSVSMPAENVIVTPQGVKLILIPAGEFLMGSPDSDTYAGLDEKPQHRVRITRPFYLGVYPVTQSQYAALMGENPSRFKGEWYRPAESVSWDDANAFCRDLSKSLGGELEGYLCRLPTEAEWEYACRAGTTTRYCFGDVAAQLGDYAWFAENSSGWFSGGKTHPVGQRKPNAWGLYDMHGNVWEWCADWYGSKYYANSPMDDPQGPASGSYHVSRGGSWSRKARSCRSANRPGLSPDSRRNDLLGFRLALVPAQSHQQLGEAETPAQWQVDHTHTRDEAGFQISLFDDFPMGSYKEDE